MFSAHGTIDNDQSGLSFPRHIYNLIHVNILLCRTNPTTIKPQDIKITVTFHQFPDLVVIIL